MNDANILDKPGVYSAIEASGNESGFTMPSDLYIGTLLKTLITSKPKSNLLELGTGAGLSSSWMIDGMDAGSRLTTIDNDPQLIEIAKSHFGQDNRIKIICANGDEWIRSYDGEKFDLIFADTWPGKYSQVEKTLELVKVGGFYIVDDMTAHPNWPEGHQEKADQLVEYLEERNDFNLTKMNWSTGLIVCAKTS